MKNFFTKLKKLFINSDKHFEIWDTCAISTYFDKFLDSVNKEEIHVIVPEGVSHELSAGRRAREVCREAYKFINESKNGKLTLYVTKDYMRSWKVDEQVVAIAYEYYKKGYNVTLITCDRDMANNAENRGLTVNLLKGNRNQAQQIQVENNIEKKPEPEKIEQEKRVEDKPTNTGEIVIDCEWVDGVPYVADNNLPVTIYDFKGKKVNPHTMANGTKLPVRRGSVAVYEGNRYTFNLKGGKILLKRMDSA